MVVLLYHIFPLIMAEPGNNCAVYNICGNYGVCNPDDNLVCKCLPGFKPNASEKWHSGDFSNGCARNSMSCGENDMFFPVYAMSWDDINRNLKTVSVKDESACKRECLKSCDCRSYSYENDTNTCYIVTQDLFDLREYDEGYNSFSVRSISVRVAISDIGTNPYHMGLHAFTEFLKLQPPAVFQQGFDCFTTNTFHLLLHHS